MFLLFFEGAALGFAISAPVGPINLLCLRRSLAHGKRIGFLTGLGAATGDAFYGAVAAFGLTAISDFFVLYQGYFQFFGGVLFFAMGMKLLRTPAPLPVGIAESAGNDAGDANSSLGKLDTSITGNTTLTGRAAFISTLFLTMTNPATIIAFLTAFASINFGVTAGNFLEPLTITFGVFAGSAVWWLVLSQFSAYYATKLAPEILVNINRGAGILLIFFSSALLWSAARKFYAI